MTPSGTHGATGTVYVSLSLRKPFLCESRAVDEVVKKKGSAEMRDSSLDEKAFNYAIRPWLGYLFLLENCPEACKPVKVREPHFEVFPEFRGASYAERYELFCRKLVIERHYDAATLLTSGKEHGLLGVYQEPDDDLGFGHFARSLVAHLGVYA